MTSFSSKRVTRNYIKNNGDNYCINCLLLFRTQHKLKVHENIGKIHDYCDTEMPEKDNNILKYNHGEKSMKTSFVI